MKKIVMITTLATLLSSCGIYNSYKRPEEIKTDNLYGEEGFKPDTTTLASKTWREIFTDPQLQTLIEKGLQNNTDLESARLRVKEAEATLMSAKLAFLPSLSLTPNGQVGSFDHSSAVWSYNAMASASWQVDIFGRTLNAERQAKALKMQSDAYQQAVHAQVVSGVASLYYTLLMLDEQLRISEETENIWKENVRMMRAMKEAGMQTEANVSQAEATYQSVIISVKSMKETINKTENAMSLILHETPHQISRGSWADQQFPEELYVGVPVQLLSNRPDVKAAEYSLQRYFYAENAARSAFYPSLTLTGQAGWTNSVGNAIVNPGKVLLGAVASLTQPVFQNGANIARLQIAKAQFQENKLSFQQTLLQAGVEVNEALVKCQTARSKEENVDKQIKSLSRALTSTQLLMDNGTTTFLQVLVARQSLLQAQVSKMSIWFDEAQGIINLYQALGGGLE